MSGAARTYRTAGAPSPAHRVIPSKFPPIGLFDTVATAADLFAVMSLSGWTNDQLVASRIARLPEAEWVYGRPNSSIVMAAFLHVAPGGMRFNGRELGAWYAAAALTTAVAEVAHHLRREAVARGLPGMTRCYRQYVSGLEGDYVDLRGARGQMPDVYNAASYAAGQVLGEGIRASSGDGVLFDSVRHTAGTNVVAYRPRKVVDVLQVDHYEIEVRAANSRIEARKLAT